MSEPIKDYEPLFEELSKLRGSLGLPSDEIPKIELKMYYCGSLLTKEQGNFSLAELDFVLRQNGCYLYTDDLISTSERLAQRGMYIGTNDGRYRTNPEYIESKSIKFLTKSDAAKLELEMKLNQLYPLLFYASSIAFAGHEVFTRTSGEYREIEYIAEKEKDPERRLEKLMEELKISPEIQNYTKGVIKLLQDSGTRIPFITPSRDMIAQVTELLRDAGIDLPHGCFDCEYHPTKCSQRDNWYICSDYRFAEILARQKAAKVEIEKKAVESVEDLKFEAEVEKAFDKELERQGIRRIVETPVMEPIERHVEKMIVIEPIESLEIEKIKWLEGSLKQVKDSMDIPDEIYDRARDITGHLVKKTPGFVRSTVELSELVMYLSSIDVNRKGLKQLLPEQRHRKESFSKSLRELIRMLHKTDFYLHHGCFDCNIYNDSECPEDLKGRKMEPWNACIVYEREEIGISSSKVEIKTEQVNQKQKTASKEEDNALRMLNRYRLPVYHRSDMPSIESFEELVNKEFATSQQILDKKTFQITGKGIEEYNRRFRKSGSS